MPGIRRPGLSHRCKIHPSVPRQRIDRIILGSLKGPQARKNCRLDFLFRVNNFFLYLLLPSASNLSLQSTILLKNKRWLHVPRDTAIYLIKTPFYEKRSTKLFCGFVSMLITMWFCRQRTSQRRSGLHRGTGTTNRPETPFRPQPRPKTTFHRLPGPKNKSSPVCDQADTRYRYGLF